MISLRSSYDFLDVILIDHGFQNPETEYLLLENRRAVRFDGGLGEGGISIWHVDESTRWNQRGGHPGMIPMEEDDNSNSRTAAVAPSWTANGVHYPLSLLQADGLFDLERSRNHGHESDLWRSGNNGKGWLGPGVAGGGDGDGAVTAAVATYPNTDSYQGGEVRSTGIHLGGFSALGDVMTLLLKLVGGGDRDHKTPAQTANPNPYPATEDPTEGPAGIPTTGATVANRPASSQPTGYPSMSGPTYKPSLLRRTPGPGLVSAGDVQESTSAPEPARVPTPGLMTEEGGGGRIRRCPRPTPPAFVSVILPAPSDGDAVPYILIGRSITVTFNNPRPLDGDWIAMYPTTSDPNDDSTLPFSGAPADWKYACGSI